MTTIRGVDYPLAIDPTTGNLLVAENAELIAGHIISVLETEPKENPLRPNYGTPGLLFESEQNFDAYVADVRRRLTAEIPLGAFETSGTLGDEGEALINISWAYQGAEQEDIEVRLS